MFKVKLVGPWRQLRESLESREQRVMAVKTRIILDLMEQFLDDLKSRVPRGGDMDVYRKSLKIVELSGVGSKVDGDVAFAIVAENEKLDVSKLPPSETVVYVSAKGDKLSPRSTMAVEYSPWTLSWLPQELSMNEVRLVHRKVSRREIIKLGKENEKVVSKFSSQFARAGIKFNVNDIKGKEKATMHSLPDIAFEALRMEFGIDRKQVRHWGYAKDRVMGHLKDMFKDKKTYGKYFSSEFKGWKTNEYESTKKPIGHMTGQDFQKKCSTFQDKIEKL
jgi:hypothetical protein